EHPGYGISARSRNTTSSSLSTFERFGICFYERFALANISSRILHTDQASDNDSEFRNYRKSFLSRFPARSKRCRCDRLALRLTVIIAKQPVPEPHSRRFLDLPIC